MQTTYLKNFFILTALTSLTACGGGGGSESSSMPSQKTVVGLAVDGYLRRATVFLDINKNGLLDSDEPNVETDENGQFKFEAPTSSLANSPIVVKVISGKTIDSDSPDGPVDKSYSLTSPVGKTDVISPITTLIAAKVENGQALADAESAVLSDLGFTQLNLYANFVEEKKQINNTNNSTILLQQQRKTLKQSNITTTDPTYLQNLKLLKKYLSQILKTALQTSN